MVREPEAWGPQYWYFLHTIAEIYPARPSATMKKKYYNFYVDLPLFIPDQKMGNDFAKMLDRYPVAPYLSSRKSLVKWTNYIHNQINRKLEKEEVRLGHIRVAAPKRKRRKWSEALTVRHIPIVMTLVVIAICSHLHNQQGRAGNMG